LTHNSFVYSKKLINGTQDRHLKMSQSEVMKVQAAGNGDDANSEQVERKVQKAVVATTAATPDGELQMKHPLQNTWTLWFYKNDKSQSWEANQKPVINFDTVEDFWSLYNHIEVASKLQIGSDYSLFKKGIKPMWEDPHNKDGGRWLISLDRNMRSLHLDNFWMEVLLLLIGEAFGEHHGQLVNGAVVNIRGKGDKIAIWMSSATHGEAILEVGRRIKSRLDIRKVDIVFENHQDTQNKHGSRGKATYYL